MCQESIYKTYKRKCIKKKRERDEFFSHKNVYFISASTLGAAQEYFSSKNHRSG